jgi:uncharacterized membrane protein
MTDVAPTPQPPSALSDERVLPLLVYLFYLIGFAIPPLTIAGLVLAYVNRETAPDWLKSHYTFQIRSFWIGLLYVAVSMLFCLILIGFLGLIAAMIWFIVRAALGLDRLLKREPYPRPESWTT